jgi:hypothetical protein
LGGQAFGLDGAPDRTVHHSLEKGQPLVGGHGRRQARAGGIPETGGEFGGEASTGVGRPSRQPHSAQNMAVVEVLGHLRCPTRAVCLHPTFEHLAEGNNQLPRCFVPGGVGPADQGAEISHGQVVGALEGGLGPVPPLGGLDPRHKGFGDGDDTLGAGLGPALLAGALTLKM